MYEKTYPFDASNFYKFFTFKSISEDKIVVKVVQFSRIRENLYNLGLADFEKGKLQFREPSNNRDVVRVLATVAAIVRRFTEIYPEREVLISGEQKRMNLYNAVFRRKIAEIQSEFEVWGFIEDEWQSYDTENNYESIKIKRKIS